MASVGHKRPRVTIRPNCAGLPRAQGAPRVASAQEGSGAVGDSLGDPVNRVAA
jgi:hypothetical protein